MHSTWFNKGKFGERESYGGLAERFGVDKTLGQLCVSYYCLRMSVDVKKFVLNCRFCQRANGRSQTPVYIKEIFERCELGFHSWVAKNSKR